jgi:hypothetical protein
MTNGSRRIADNLTAEVLRRQRAIDEERTLIEPDRRGESSPRL